MFLEIHTGRKELCRLIKAAEVMVVGVSLLRPCRPLTLGLEATSRRISRDMPP